MIARASQLFLPTLRDDPADAEAASHKLLVRGGFIRQVSAGLWTFMPLGWRVHRRSSRSSARRWTRSAGRRCSCPVLTPAELWEATGRIDIPEILFRLKDRDGTQLHPPGVARGDDHLPRAGDPVVQGAARSSGTTSRRRTATSRGPRRAPARARVRHEGLLLVRSGRGGARCGASSAHRRHTSAMLERCGVEAYYVEAESGIMGGGVSSASSRRRGRARTSSCAARTAITRGHRGRAGDSSPARLPGAADRARRGRDAGRHNDRGACGATRDRRAATSKAMPVVVGGTLVLALVRGDDRLSEKSS